MAAEHEGVINPPIDDLLERADSKYELVILASRRARQINSYYQELQEGAFENVGPLVTPEPNEKPLSIAMREVDEGKLLIRDPRESDFAAPAAEEYGFDTEVTFEQ
ncbi:DNA-directed RNA polymerase subunit omega [Brevibacterium litoralis]|uniref:DNA-directed RNA polymerase subunit omega n=1 Tax=Brevibacterium litoralis TaxID=3138935 RepID=UPI0032F06862